MKTLPVNVNLCLPRGNVRKLLGVEPTTTPWGSENQFKNIRNPAPDRASELSDSTSAHCIRLTTSTRDRGAR